MSSRRLPARLARFAALAFLWTAIAQPAVGGEILWQYDTDG